MSKTDDLLSLIAKVLIDTQVHNLTIAKLFEERLKKINGPVKTKRSKKGNQEP